MSLVCWWCVHELPGMPCISLPMKYDERLKTFYTIGNFCSWACAKAYAIDMGSARKDEYCSLLALMRHQALGKWVPLWPAPKRQCLASFGGTLTIEEFRSYGGHIEPPHIYWPFEKKYIPVQVDTRHAVASASSSGIVNGPGRLRAIENTQTSEAGDTLRLRRTKPLVRTTSKLENVLGIKRTSC